MVVSFIIIAYNAEKVLSNSLDCIKNQNYPHDKVEVILVDSNSTDNTKKIFMNFKKKNNDFKKIIILENKKKILPSGWNIALEKASGDVILRVDAHSSFPNNFILSNVNEIKKGEDIVGGHRISVSLDNTKWQNVLLIAEQSLFGSGIAKYRRTNKKEYVNTLAHAMYKKEVFEKVGFYNENLVRTEDNEMHYRMKKAGYKFLLSPNIVSYHNARNSFSGMIKQKFFNGYWIGVTMKYCPKCFSLYHFVPLLFVLSLIISIILFFNSFKIFLILIGFFYLIFNIANLIIIYFLNTFSLLYLVLPFIFLILHLSYGIGTLTGLIKCLFIRKEK